MLVELYGCPGVTHRACSGIGQVPGGEKKERKNSLICAKFVQLKIRSYHGKQPVRLAA